MERRLGSTTRSSALLLGAATLLLLSAPSPRAAAQGWGFRKKTPAKAAKPASPAKAKRRKPRSTPGTPPPRLGAKVRRLEEQLAAANRQLDALSKRLAEVEGSVAATREQPEDQQRVRAEIERLREQVRFLDERLRSEQSPPAVPAPPEPAAAVAPPVAPAPVAPLAESQPEPPEESAAAAAPAPGEELFLRVRKELLEKELKELEARRAQLDRAVREGLDPEVLAGSFASVDAELRRVRADLARLESLSPGALRPAPGALERLRENTAQLQAVLEQMAQLDAAVEQGLDPSSVAQSHAELRQRVEELEEEQRRITAVPLGDGTSSSAVEGARSPAPGASEQRDVSASPADQAAPSPSLSSGSEASEPAPPSVPASAAGASAQQVAHSGSPASTGRGRSRIEGFLDLQSRAWGTGGLDHSEPMVVGQAEVDVLADFTPSLKSAVALAWDGDQDAFVLGAAALEWTIVPPEAGQKAAQMALVVGRFDVPFGLYWRYLGSFSRRTITEPLSGQLLGTYWNTEGVDLYGRMAGGAFYWCLFALRGRDGGAGLGGRVSLRGQGLPELGLNFATELPEASRATQQLIDFDLQWYPSLGRAGALALRGEFVFASRRIDPDSDVWHRHQGLYLEGIYSVARVFFLGRFSWVDVEEGDLLQLSGSYTEVVAGGGAVLIPERLELRLEYGHRQAGDLDYGVAQLAATF